MTILLKSLMSWRECISIYGDQPEPDLMGENSICCKQLMGRVHILRGITLLRRMPRPLLRHSSPTMSWLKDRLGRNCDASEQMVEGNSATNFGKPIVRSSESFTRLHLLTRPNPMALLNVLIEQSLNV